MNHEKTSKEKIDEKATKSPYEEYTEMQVRAAFEVFDEDQNGRAKLKHLGTILRALGRVLTNSDVQIIAENLNDPENPKYMRIEDLLPVATKMLLHDNYKSTSRTSLLEAFKKLDRSKTGYLDADCFKKVIKEHGDNIDDETVEKFISDFVEDGTRKINYEEVCVKLAVLQCIDITDNRRKIRLELSRESSRNT